MPKNQYPKEEGWLRMEITMKSKTPLGVDEIKKIATWGNADSYEFGPIEQYGAKIKVIMREKKEASHGA